MVRGMTKRVRRGLGLLLVALLAWFVAQVIVAASGPVAVYALGWAVTALAAAAGIALLLLGLLRD